MATRTKAQTQARAEYDKTLAQCVMKKLVVKGAGVTASLQYAPNDGYLHLSLFRDNDELCLDRLSLPLSKVVKTLGLPFILNTLGEPLVEI